MIAKDEKNISKITNEILKLQFVKFYILKFYKGILHSSETGNLKRTRFATESGLEEVLKNIEIGKLKNIKEKY